MQAQQLNPMDLKQAKNAGALAFADGKPVAPFFNGEFTERACAVAGGKTLSALLEAYVHGWAVADLTDSAPVNTNHRTMKTLHQLQSDNEQLRAAVALLQTQLHQANAVMAAGQSLRSQATTAELLATNAAKANNCSRLCGDIERELAGAGSLQGARLAVEARLSYWRLRDSELNAQAARRHEAIQACTFMGEED